MATLRSLHILTIFLDMIQSMDSYCFVIREGRDSYSLQVQGFFSGGFRFWFLSWLGTCLLSSANRQNQLGIVPLILLGNSYLMAIAESGISWHKYLLEILLFPFVSLK